MQNQPTPLNDLKALRRQIRRQRAALTATQQQHYAQAMLKRLSRLRIFRAAQHIALYLPIQGEADPTAIHRYALPKQRFYLPVINPHATRPMIFIQWRAQTRFKINRYGILEPRPPFQFQRNARQLDLVITPLVAFDAQGHRLGMGGGFYDRTFAFKRRVTQQTLPYLVGFAYSFQQVSSLPKQLWDIPLDAVITEQTFISF